MPYEIEERDGEFLILEKGKVVGKSKTKKDAEASIRARWASKDAVKEEKFNTLTGTFEIVEGGQGSGNFGYSGVPGQLGGSGSDGGGSDKTVTGTPVGNVKLKPDAVREKVHSEMRSIISRSSNISDKSKKANMMKVAKHTINAAVSTGYLSKEEMDALNRQL